MQKKVLAFDFGASSGRAIVGLFDGNKINLIETHRFSNDPVMMGDTFFWDFPRLMFEIKQGIVKTANAGHKDVLSIGIDTWGVDFGLLAQQGRLMQNPVHYRNEKNVGSTDELLTKYLSKKEIYGSTGIQFMDFNSANQLCVLKEYYGDVLHRAEDLLFIPDLMGYFLSGEKVQEYTNASTSGLLNAFSRDWDFNLIDKLGINRKLFKKLTMPGVVTGRLSDSICSELAFPKVDIVSVASHDTGSAVLSVPATDGDNYAYISCGTWSLLGFEAEEPKISNKSFEYNFTNEGGFGNTIRVLKNICGLWLMQESRRHWIKEGENLSFKDLDELTVKAEPLVRFIDPDYAPFVLPNEMPVKIAKYCRETGQSAPQTKGEVTRCITESLALKYRYHLAKVEELSGKAVDTIHIIGGGVNDKLLCQFTANATGKRVVAGPVEATAIGNIVAQLIAQKEFASVSQARECIKNSFDVAEYLPQDIEVWEQAFEKFKKIIGG